MPPPPIPPARSSGRPLATGARRTLLMRFRATPEEAAEIEARALLAGLSLSDFLRQSARTARLVSSRKTALDPATLHHLALLGSNMNQIARVLNVSGDTDRAYGLDELAAEVRTLLDTVRDHVR